MPQNLDIKYLQVTHKASLAKMMIRTDWAREIVLSVLWPSLQGVDTLALVGPLLDTMGRHRCVGGMVSNM